MATKIDRTRFRQHLCVSLTNVEARNTHNSVVSDLCDTIDSQAVAVEEWEARVSVLGGEVSRLCTRVEELELQVATAKDATIDPGAPGNDAAETTDERCDRRTRQAWFLDIDDSVCTLRSASLPGARSMRVEGRKDRLLVILGVHNDIAQDLLDEIDELRLEVKALKQGAPIPLSDLDPHSNYEEIEAAAEALGSEGLPTPEDQAAEKRAAAIDICRRLAPEVMIQPSTEPWSALGKRLMEIRRRIVESGQPLLDWDELARRFYDHDEVGTVAPGVIAPTAIESIMARLKELKDMDVRVWANKAILDSHTTHLGDVTKRVAKLENTAKSHTHAISVGHNRISVVESRVEKLEAIKIESRLDSAWRGLVNLTGQLTACQEQHMDSSDKDSECVPKKNEEGGAE